MTLLKKIELKSSMKKKIVSRRSVSPHIPVCQVLAENDSTLFGDNSIFQKVHFNMIPCEYETFPNRTEFVD